MVKIAVVAGLLIAGVYGQFALARHRPVSSPIATEGVFAALGGLRSLAAEAVWFRADRLKDEGQYVELAQLASTLTFLEPHVSEVWSYSAWNLAYNISVMMPRMEDRWHWVASAIRLLRDDGLRLNPTESELYRELALLFEVKIGADIDDAASLYREEWARIVRDVQSRNAWEELRMDPAVMAEVERKYRVSDWQAPQMSAIYWAHLGLAHANETDRKLLLNTIRQSCVVLRRQAAKCQRDTFLRLQDESRRRREEAMANSPR